MPWMINFSSISFFRIYYHELFIIWYINNLKNYYWQYFKIKYIDKINDYERIANNENKNINNIKDSYSNKGGIDKYYCDKLRFDIDNLSEIKKYFNEFNTFYNSYYNNERKEIFQSFEIFKL